MGEYAPEDQRTVHKNSGPDSSMSDWHDREKSERERQHEQHEASKAGKDTQAQQGYSNARGENGKMEQDAAVSSQGEGGIDNAETGNAQPGEISDRPDKRAAADANRPLEGS